MISEGAKPSSPPSAYQQGKTTGTTVHPLGTTFEKPNLPEMPSEDTAEQQTVNHPLSNCSRTTIPRMLFDIDTSPLDTSIKPYWSTWEMSHQHGYDDAYAEKNPFLKHLGQEEPLYTIAEDVAQRKRVSHQVQTGKPMVYAHKSASPRYMDTHDNPYAVFVFQYRSKG